MADRLENYASPPLRAAIFNRLYPGSQIHWSDPLPIEEAFPDGWWEYEGKATEAVRCQIDRSDGCVFVAYKEIDLVDKGRPQAQTPENLAKNETKALGRALTKAGIPMAMSELQSLMRWLVALDGPTAVAPVVPVRPANVNDDGEVEGSSSPDGDDPADDPGPTLEQQIAARFALLPGGEKVRIVTAAKEAGILNVLKPGRGAEKVMELLDAIPFEEE